MSMSLIGRAVSPKPPPARISRTPRGGVPTSAMSRDTDAVCVFLSGRAVSPKPPPLAHFADASGRRPYRFVAGLGLVLGISFSSSVLAALPPADSPAPTNAVLAVDEINDARQERVVSQPWVRALRGPQSSVTGVVQEMVCRGVKVRIQYGAFEDVAAAHAAALFHVANTSALFQTGLWSRTQGPVVPGAIGDESWWTRSDGSQAVLLRSGKICALISCREGDGATRDKVAEEIAARIAAKARTARRVAAPPVANEEQ